MTRDYLVSFIAEGLAVLLSLGVYRVAAAQWSPGAFAEYVLARKVLSAIVVVGLLGMDTAVVRFVALERGERAHAYRGGALAIALGGSVLVALVLAVTPDLVGPLLFGGSGHEAIVPALGVVTIGAAVQGVAYGYLRGRLMIGRAGLLLVVLAAVPLVSVAALAGPVAALIGMGVGWAAVGAIALLASASGWTARPSLVPLLAYGGPRSVGLLLQMGFLAAPAVVAAHQFGVIEGGNVAFALLVLGIVSTLLTPIGVVLLPRSARVLSGPGTDALADHVRSLLLVVVPLVTVGVLAVELAAEPLVAVYLGAPHADAAAALRGIMWAAIPWGIFITLRGVLDAFETRPLNARNVVVATATYAILAAAAVALDAGQAAHYVAFTLAVAVLGALTLVDAARTLGRGIPAA